MMPKYHEIVGTGELENKVNTEPLDELKVSIGWEEKSPSSPVSLNSFSGSKDEEFNIEMDIYLNEQGQELVNNLAQLREFGEDFQSVLNGVFLLGISIAFPGSKISDLLGILYVASLPLTTVKLRGYIRADPIMNVWCISCGSREQLNPKTPDEYSQIRENRQKCSRCGSKETRTQLIK